VLSNRWWSLERRNETLLERSVQKNWLIRIPEALWLCFLACLICAGAAILV
jgi:hypothetical protein